MEGGGRGEVGREEGGRKVGISHHLSSRHRRRRLAASAVRQWTFPNVPHPIRPSRVCVKFRSVQPRPRFLPVTQVKESKIDQSVASDQLLVYKEIQIKIWGSFACERLCLMREASHIFASMLCV